MDVTDVKKKLLSLECPFTWKIPPIEVPLEQNIKSLKEKRQTIDVENEFNWPRYSIDIMLAYELCKKMKEYKGALEHVNSSIQHIDRLIKQDCQEPLFCTIKVTLIHIALASKAHILLSAGRTDEIIPILSKIVLVKEMSTSEKAGIFGIQSVVFTRYGTKGQRMALECATKAKNLDPKQAEWYFLIGKAMGRIRRVEYTEISTEEFDAIKKACELQQNTAHLVHLATLYSELSSFWFYNPDKSDFRGNMQKSKVYAKTAVKYFKEAVKVCPTCPTLKARVAHGILRIRCKEAMDITYTKQLLDDVVEMTPNNGMVYHDLGLYYDKFESNIQKALASLKKGNELNNIKALFYSIILKWKHGRGLEKEIIGDLQKGLAKYRAVECQSELLTLLVAIYLLNDDWQTAIIYANKSLKVDPSAMYLQNHHFFGGNKKNLLQIIRNELLRKGKPVLPEYKQFLELTKGFNSDNGKEIVSFYEWKSSQMKLKATSRR